MKGKFHWLRLSEFDCCDFLSILLVHVMFDLKISFGSNLIVIVGFICDDFGSYGGESNPKVPTIKDFGWSNWRF